MAECTVAGKEQGHNVEQSGANKKKNCLFTTVY